MNVLLVMAGAVAGAPARYLLDRAVQRRHRSAFPFGTLVVNLIACLLLGLVSGAVTRGASTTFALIAGTGFCATFSTYSTFSAETVTLARRGRPRAAVLNAAGSTVAGTALAYAGFEIARWLFG